MKYPEIIKFGSASSVQLARSFGDTVSMMWNSLQSSLRAIEETRKFKTDLKLFFLNK